VGHDGTGDRYVLRDNEAGYFTDFLRVPPLIIFLAIALIRQHIITFSVSHLALGSLLEFRTTIHASLLVLWPVYEWA
jgi:hypothetical protein